MPKKNRSIYYIQIVRRRNMPKAIKIYLDTSVLNAYFDDRVISRMEITRDFWKRIDQYEVSFRMS
jgi:hypothetical protein